jgi:hypothetical protein
VAAIIEALRTSNWRREGVGKRWGGMGMAGSFGGQQNLR